MSASLGGAGQRKAKDRGAASDEPGKLGIIHDEGIDKTPKTRLLLVS